MRDALRAKAHDAVVGDEEAPVLYLLDLFYHVMVWTGTGIARR